MVAEHLIGTGSKLFSNSDAKLTVLIHNQWVTLRCSCYSLQQTTQKLSAPMWVPVTKAKEIVLVDDVMSFICLHLCSVFSR